MEPKFKVGDICIGQNFVEDTECNGMECEVIGVLKLRRVVGLRDMTCRLIMGYEVLWADGAITSQEPHFLRRRQPPTTGEQSIRVMFDTPMADRRRPVTAWQAQYDTAQALMTMGVRVRPGKWPVEVV